MLPGGGGEGIGSLFVGGGAGESGGEEGNACTVPSFCSSSGTRVQ